jgi:hypothetical protein
MRERRSGQLMRYRLFGLTAFKDESSPHSIDEVHDYNHVHYERNG